MVWIPGEGDVNPLQYSCLENPMDRGVWQSTVHGFTRVRHDLATNHHDIFKGHNETNMLNICYLQGPLYGFSFSLHNMLMR